MINRTKLSKNKKETSKGITLIALVITIIVLLILAAVSVAMLTGENGILTKANTAEYQTIEAEEKEQIRLAYSTVIADKLHREDNSAVTADELQAELNNQNVEATTASKDNNQIEVTFTKSKNVYTVDGGTGKITGMEHGGGESYNTADTVTDAITQDKPFETKTEIYDTFGNKVVVPEGFKIASDSGNNVTEGVVIEDVSYGETEGSQFVWIPVGTVYKNAEKTQSTTITLGRYDFNSTTGEPSAYSGDYKEENANDTDNLLKCGNTIAKDIEDFKTKASVTQSGGYYIGRYEARVANKRTTKTDNDAELEKVTVKASDFVYNYIKQPQAAKLARAMYEGSDKTFTSDLINSYAWDTAIVFLQEFDNRETDRTKPYSRQNSLNTGSIAEKGTNRLTEVEKQDKICNIWDMASNDWEWTTETSADFDNPCAPRGGHYNLFSPYTSLRYSYSTTLDHPIGSFRLILYL